MIAIIVAVSDNGVIGNKNDLPWYLPADLKHFKETTTGSTVIMGRNTYESIVARLHGPLPNRRNIILSRSQTRFDEGFERADSIQQALSITGNETDAFIIGGQAVYEESLKQNVVDCMYITEVHTDISGDVFFPAYNKDLWRETSRLSHESDDKNKYDYDFVTLERIK